MAEKRSAFLKGGLGCLGVFLIVGIVTVCAGGNMHIDPGGAVCLFVGGGLLGLVVLFIYNRGRRDAGGGDGG